MIALRTIQIALLGDGKTWFDIGTEGYPYMDDLEEIAFGDTTVASFQGSVSNYLVHLETPIKSAIYQSNDSLKAA